MRLAVLSNITPGFLIDMLKREHECWSSDGHAQWIQECLSPSPAFAEFEPECILVLLDGRTIHEGGDDLLVFESALGSLCRNFPNVLVAVSNLDVPCSCIRPFVSACQERSLERAWQETLDELMTEWNRVCVFDIKAIVEEMGRARFYDERMRYAGAMPYSIFGLRALASGVSDLLRAYVGKRKKVLAVDFDNTLWKGVIGEDGVAGVLLGPDKEGLPFTDFQRRLKEIKNSGALLVALSKNNEEDVEPIWHDSRMVLKKEDFVAICTDWNDKPSNLVAVAKMLNIGTDSFVFIDDNLAEREQMRSVCPEVAVPEFPHDDAGLEVFARQIAREFFPCYRPTHEDANKTEQYRAESNRRSFARSGISLQDYLVRLEQWAVIHAARSEEVERIVQLSQKTNQFNVTTHRYEPVDVCRFVQESNRILLTVHSGDRFGNQGLIAFLNVVIAGNVAQIEDFVMSCRVMNRTMEFAIEEELEEMLVRRRVRALEAVYRPTPKNKPVAELFEKMGFSLVSAQPGESGEKHYKKSIPSSFELVNYVTRKGM